MASLKELQAARDGVLLAIYEESGGQILNMVSSQEITTRTGLSGDPLENALLYLSNEGYIELMMGGAARLEHLGLKHAEYLLSQTERKITRNRPPVSDAERQKQEQISAEQVAPANRAQPEPSDNAKPTPAEIVSSVRESLTVSPWASADGGFGISEDLLGRRPYVDAFSDFFTTSNIPGPFTVAITGTWGEGKSVFLEWVSVALREKGYKTVWFNAWKYDTKHTVWASLALAILESHKTWLLGFQLWASRAMERITAFELFALFFVITSLISIALIGVPGPAFRLAIFLPGLALSYGFIKGLWKTFSGPLIEKLRSTKSLDLEKELGFQYQFEKEFQRLLQILSANNKPLIIFVDDLDRLSPLKIAEVFEAIHFLGDSKKCVFVVGIDLKTVAGSLATRYGEKPSEFGYQFMDKFLHLVFSLPEPTDEQVENYVSWLIGAEAKELATDLASKQTGRDAMRAVQNHIDDDNSVETTFETSEKVGSIVRRAMKWIPHNPRKIKRFVNNFRLSAFIAYRLRLLETNEIDLLSLAALLVARQNYPRLFELLFEQEADEILVALGEILQGRANEKHRVIAERYGLHKFHGEGEELRELVPVLYGANSKYRQLLDLVH